MGDITVFCAKLLVWAFLVNVASLELKNRTVRVSTSNLGGLYGDWWKHAVIYEIVTRSFKDSDNDGNGDLQGIIQKLDYIKGLGVDAIWLSPIYKSPQLDIIGYDVADYRNIDPMYGTLDDLRQLIDQAHKLNIKVLMDYVPNHSSNQHEWFHSSLKRDPKYDEYYIWRNASYDNGERKPPNNWISLYGGPAWTWSEERQQYYFHQFSYAQPDLNYRNPDVIKEMKDVFRYWLEFGVDGYRMDALMTLFEDPLFRDDPKSGNPSANPDDPSYVKHIYSLNLPESFEMIYQWRDILDEFNKQNTTYERIIIAEGSHDRDEAYILHYYGNTNRRRLGGNFAFNYLTFITRLSQNFTALDLLDSIEAWINNVPASSTNNWVLGNHDFSRVATRLGAENIDGLNMLSLILPGVQVTYLGEEIGQENGEVTCEEGYDPKGIRNCSTFDIKSRDFSHTPFQWDNTTNAGFNTGAKTWLPVSEKYIVINLASQNVPNINSHYNIYKQLLHIRQEFRNTYFDELTYSASENILFIKRTTDNAVYAFYWNIGDKKAKIFPELAVVGVTVVTRSINSDYFLGDSFNLSRPLKPGEAVLGRVKINR